MGLWTMALSTACLVEDAAQMTPANVVVVADRDCCHVLLVADYGSLTVV